MHTSIALVTGAAGGIGAEVTRLLASRGTPVAAVDHDQDRLEAAVAGFTAAGLPVRGFPADVTDSKSVDGLVTAVEDTFGPVDRLVNAAGVLRMGPVLEFGDEDWAATFAVNVTGVLHMCRAVVGRMIPRRRGAIVTVSSNAAGTPRAGMAAYAASKAAATQFTKSLGLEVAAHGIRCNLVAPGSTNTPMLHAMWADEEAARRTLDGSPEAYRVGIPLRRIGQPTDVAHAVAFLLSEEASHITLHDLTVDGGASLGV
ncbi:2,3-dihydro-2,3-dihydroxybenzoate dehydrogenase [Streptomyces sp. NPDC088387]|uniref:2,3-dihydro-2,3-dihydroxybenzoate dehydrogenase n=1 Tax=Streptomyces sp. NPDC088387 TaxID=3365859 RepID=UPI00381B676F